MLLVLIVGKILHYLDKGWMIANSLQIHDLKTAMNLHPSNTSSLIVWFGGWCWNGRIPLWRAYSYCICTCVCVWGLYWCLFIFRIQHHKSPTGPRHVGVDLKEFQMWLTHVCGEDVVPEVVQVDQLQLPNVQETFVDISQGIKHSTLPFLYQKSRIKQITWDSSINTNTWRVCFFHLKKVPKCWSGLQAQNRGMDAPVALPVLAWW